MVTLQQEVQGDAVIADMPPACRAQSLRVAGARRREVWGTSWDRNILFSHAPPQAARKGYLNSYITEKSEG